MPVEKTQGQEASGGDVRLKEESFARQFPRGREYTEIEHDFALSGTLHWAKTRWRGKWAEDMAEAWNRQIFEAAHRHVKSHP